jgi:uncharacterized protein (TIGR02118 family)
LFSALILFGFPRDREAFEDHFAESYRSLLLAIPKLEKLIVNRVAGAVKGDPPFYALVELQFASEEAMQEGLNSAEGQAMARELGSFASGGYTVLFSRATVEG